MAASRLRAPAETFTILDPCAGEGTAVAQLASLLGCRPDNVYAIELEEGRAATLKRNLPEARIVAPASVFGCAMSFASLGMIWLNSPFDNHFGGDRVETEWMNFVKSWLAPGGVLCLVCPEDTVGEWTTMRRELAKNFTDLSVTPFPEDKRTYEEVVVFGVKRPMPLAEYSAEYNRGEGRWERCQVGQDHVYPIPSCLPPRRFVKVEPTEADLQRALAVSPLSLRWKQPQTRNLPSPPLAIGMGHLALLLASGHLDGTVTPPGGTPHAVRGTCRKKEYVSSKVTTENDDGDSTTKTVISEKIELVVRAVGLDGQVRTFTDATDAAPAATDGG
jgi:hypothetical protein